MNTQGFELKSFGLEIVNDLPGYWTGLNSEETTPNVAILREILGPFWVFFGPFFAIFSRGPH